MELVIEFAKLLIPAAIVLYAMYLVVKSFLDKEIAKQSLEVRGKSIETVLPNRLHAYERVCLFLERITLNNLIPRLNNGQYTAREFQHIMINEIREEYNHNVSQQLYMSNEVWEMVKSAKEELITLINESVAEMKPEATNLDLARHLFEKAAHLPDDKIQVTLLTLKNEIRQAF
ncbi:DUF7935 family protein [Fulvivirga ligni]|uniref:DUF7935 family protein n=1 Tax=Fulvivirga ligni TaxID=2904246 RepID=UPI001F1A57DB|nr:hypothetical protein [Fulvivirga ligni]UII23025.1 hypothetical protein LVD16_07280 [Fulvivirga ligni]